MRLTTKGRFAVTAMIDLALRSNNGPVRLGAFKCWHENLLRVALNQRMAPAPLAEDLGSLAQSPLRGHARPWAISIACIACGFDAG